jgi:hypothetical protein
MQVLIEILTAFGDSVHAFLYALLSILDLVSYVGDFLLRVLLWLAGTFGLAMEFAVFGTFLGYRSNRCDSYTGSGFWIGGCIGGICTYLLLVHRSVGQTIESVVGLAIVLAVVFFLPRLAYEVYLRFCVPGQQTAA